MVLVVVVGVAVAVIAERIFDHVAIPDFLALLGALAERLVGQAWRP